MKGVEATYSGQAVTRNLVSEVGLTLSRFFATCTPVKTTSNPLKDGFFIYLY